jgi:alpha-L-fucosidase
LAALLSFNANTISQDTNFWVFLCFGQSNMEGFPGINPSDQEGVDARFQVLAAVDFPKMDRMKGLWYPAVPPLCRPSSGLCPADYFGRTLVSNLPPHIKVGVVNVSVAGCKIELFEKGTFQSYAATAPRWMTNTIATYSGNPYRHLVEMAKLAQKDGVIKGILLHQGESNTNDKEWPNKVLGIYSNLLQDLSLKPQQVPLLVGELVSADQKGACASMNRIIGELPQTIPTAHVVSSAGCIGRPDRLHFTPAGYRELGTRYAEKLLSLLGYTVAERKSLAVPAPDDRPTTEPRPFSANVEPGAPIPYSTMQLINVGDSPGVIAEKAAKVLPRPNQTAWMRLERTFFLHFGVNTFNEVEWGSGREEPSLFNPTALDANQWLGAVKNFGGNLFVLVAKHHEGFCMWPTRYTPHSTVSSPWRGGKGDLVREVANAARAQGVKLAVYLSPADLYQLKTNPKNLVGYYGNGSSNVLSAIPTDPASFQSNPANGRTPAPGFTNYTYVVDDYNRYFLNQLYELLTEYGPIHEVWFDGANPDPSVHETYNYEAWYHLIRSLQPDAVIMGKGPDVRWVGNESGVGRTTEWSVIPLPTSPGQFKWPDMTAGDLGSRAKLKPGSHLWWYPAEVNTTILGGNQWFWARNKHPRTVTQLVDIFYTSVGRNGNLILNLSPDKRGLVPDNQLDALSRTAQIINETFATDLSAGGKVTADASNATNNPSLAMDDNLDTWWEAAPGQTNGTVTLTLPKAVTFDVVSLQEAVAQRGQRIESFVIETWNGSEWINAEKIQSDELTTVGHRRLIRLKSPVTSDQVRIRIIGSRLEPTLAELGLFKQSIKTLPPAISDRSTNGTVSLSNLAGYKMVYTVDGSAPTTNSPVYTAPIALPLDRSVTVRAASLLPNGQLGLVGSRVFAGLMPIGWKVVNVDSEETAGADNSAARAIDGDSSTFWHTRWNADQRQPHSIAIDMGTTHRIGGFTYLPRQDGLLNGVVERYRFESSVGGVTWTTNIASGSFANIQNNPSLQEVSFAPVEARYFRFTSLRAIWNSGWTSAAEISVLPAGGSGN